MFIDANQFDFMRSAVTFLYVILGGASNPFGPIVGAAIVTLLPEMLRVVQDWRMTVFGTLLVVIAIWRPDGLLPSLRSRASMSPLLSVTGVSRRFGGYLALKDVSCDVAAGHVHALIGPNGAGKTTLFNIVSGALRPTTGRLAFEGNDYTGRRPDRVLKMGIARNFQQVRLVRGLSIVENVMIGRHARIDRGIVGNAATFFGLGRRASARLATRRATMLDFVGFPAKRHLQPAGAHARRSAPCRNCARARQRAAASAAR